MKTERIAIVLIALLTAAIIGVAVYDFVFVPNSQKSPITTSFLNEPVVDVIIPKLFEGGENAPLNVSLGEHMALQVRIYPTVELDVMMDFRVISSSSGGNYSNAILATFDPGTVDVSANSNGNTTMNIYVPLNTTTGTYDSVVSAVNLSNSSQYWGPIVQIDVSS
jgi:hypothetical protein